MLFNFFAPKLSDLICKLTAQENSYKKNEKRKILPALPKKVLCGGRSTWLTFFNISIKI